MQEQLLLWDIGWTDQDFELKVSKALTQVDKLRKGIHVRYDADQRKIEELEGVIQDIVSCRADRSQAMGEF